MANPFGGLPMNQAEFMRYGGDRLNPVMNMTDPLNIPPSLTNARIQGATQTLAVTASPAGDKPVYVRNQYNPNRRPADEGRLQRAIQICESVKSADCSAFKNPDFAANCVIAHVPGTNSKGEQQLGGFVLFEEDRISQEQAAVAQGRAPVYKATVGTLPLSKVSVSEESCSAMTESAACATAKNFGTPNCASCQDGTDSWYRVPPTAVRESGSLILVGPVGATYKLVGTGLSKTGTFGSKATEIELPADAEGQTYELQVSGVPAADLFVGGALEGPTVRGKSSLDLAFITNYDIAAGAKPRFIGAADLRDGEQVNKIRPGVGKDRLALRVYVPYTYLASTEEAANQCAGGPFITKEASATLLASDPCFQSRVPNMSCLQDRFLSAGCTTSGEGYPSNEAKATALRMVGGQQQTIGDITSRIASASIIAATGRRPDGQSVPISTWDAESRFCTGKRISSPCDKEGPLSDECLASLYSDSKTYTLPADKYSSLTRAGFPGQCTPAGLASPSRPEAAAAARAQGSVEAVRRYYDNIHRRANDNTLTDAERSAAVAQCYGINFAPDNRQTVTTKLASGAEISFRGAQDSNYLRHKNFFLRKEPYDGSDLNRKDATYRQVTPLCGLPGFVSLQATNYPTHYIVPSGERGAIKPRQNTTEYEDQACWKMEPCSTGSGIQLESRALPGRYLINRGSEVYVTKPTAKDGACWQNVKPL